MRLEQCKNDIEQRNMGIQNLSWEYHELEKQDSSLHLVDGTPLDKIQDHANVDLDSHTVEKMKDVLTRKPGLATALQVQGLLSDVTIKEEISKATSAVLKDQYATSGLE